MDSETGSDQPASGVASAIPAALVLAPDRAEEQSTPVYDWLVVGRECGGTDERHRLLVEDPALTPTPGKNAKVEFIRVDEKRHQALPTVRWRTPLASRRITFLDA